MVFGVAQVTRGNFGKIFGAVNVGQDADGKIDLLTSKVKTVEESLRNLEIDTQNCIKILETVTKSDLSFSDEALWTARVFLRRIAERFSLEFPSLEKLLEEAKK